jgi:uncharacterized membrane protein
MMPDIHFLEPFAAALLLPALIAWWYIARNGTGRWWRLALILVVILACMRPECRFDSGGSDVIFIADRSASMGQARNEQDALIRTIAEQRRGADRFAVIVAGDGAHLAQAPQKTGIPDLLAHPIADTASDLTTALELAHALTTPGRTGRIIIHSDGEWTGPDARIISSRIAQQHIPIDVIAHARPAQPDAAVLDIQLPQSLRLGESFIGSARFISDANEQRSYKIMRGERIIAQGVVSLTPYMPVTLSFADRPTTPGLERYVVSIERDTASALAARIVALGKKANDLLPPGADAGKFVALIEKLSQTPEGHALFTQLATPGETQDKAITTWLAAIEKEVGPTLRGVAEKLIRDEILRPVTDHDRNPANNQAIAALRIAGGERILVMSGNGQDGNIARALRSAGMSVDSIPEGTISLDKLLGYRVLVLDQVPADALKLPGMERVAQWVEHFGGGLILTGGRRSFGSGGYHKSPIERILPVTMELRDEHRKLSLAMAITMDRSGSMAVPVPGNRTKMDLANEGAAAVIELLGPRDAVAVHVVDSEPHVIIPLTPVTNPKQMAREVLGLRSEGGGIYVYPALVAAGRELLKTNSGTRHLVLFADANDAEEPGDYKNLLADYTAAGITVSVVALGTANDQDARFLEDVAKRGNGRIAFAEQPEDIPRLFAQETMLVARSSWINDPVTLQSRARIQVDLGNTADFSAAWPTVAGYNLSYARERAHIWAMAPGDPTVPALTAWHIGAGRSVAASFVVDDPASPALMQWSGYAPLITSMVRWCSGGDVAPGQLTAERSGRTVTVQLELDPRERANWPIIPPQLFLPSDRAIGQAQKVSLIPIDVGRYEARFQLDDTSVILPTVTVNDQAIIGPAVNLPYHPEAEPRFGQLSGKELLQNVVNFGKGTLRQDLVGVYDNPASPGQLLDLTSYLVGLLVLVLVGEILVRRLRLRWKRQVSVTIPATRKTTVNPPLITPEIVPAIEKTPTPKEQEKGLHDALRELKKRR